MDLSAFTFLVSRLYSNLLPVPCFLCGKLSIKLALCVDCISDLPMIQHACKRCALPLPTSGICGQCLQSPPIQDTTFSLLQYRSPVDRCISAYKFSHQLYFIPLLSELMAKQLRQRRSLPQLLVPVPLHPKRLRQRGFNQSLEIAKSLGRQLHIAVDKNALQRVIDTPSQHSLPYSQRRKNMKNAFQTTKPKLPSHIALIDDVLTSGHTVGEAAKVLRRCGVDTIEVWTIARAIRHY